MRRRHGIPDNDHRPFNVAYAAVVRARQEKEAAQKAKVTQLVPQNDRRSAQTGQDVRQRFGMCLHDLFLSYRLLDSHLN